MQNYCMDLYSNYSISFFMYHFFFQSAAEIVLWYSK